MPNVLEIEPESATLKKVGDFEILGKIGQGGIAEIYLGKQMSLDRLVAIKILSPDFSLDPEIVKRFEVESHTIAHLKHPNIVHVIDRGTEEGRYYFAMDLVEGTNFKKMLEDKTVPLARKFTIIIQVLKALDYAHKNGVIHRDIKPANILIDKNGNALVADFGIAQILDKEDYEKTQPGMIMGSLPYMSPEQRLSAAELDQTADLYAVGVILYEILTGEKPVGRFKKPSALNNGIAPELDRIVLKCLEHHPQDRYQSAAELKDDLLRTLHKKSEKPEAQKEFAGDIKDYIGRLSFLDTLGETKQAATHLVENQTDGRMYVIKTLQKSQAGIKEAKLLKSLAHPGFIKILGAGGHADKSVILMEYMRGGSLEDRLVRIYPPRVALQIFRQIIGNLDFAHRNRIVHGNLRPANILFDEADNPVISDFGQAINHRHSKQDWYLAPERTKTELSDIYSAGVILHRLLVNQFPIFDSYLRLIWQDSYPKVPTSLKMLIMQMLRNGIKDRPQSFGEVMTRIDECERELIALQSQSTSSQVEQKKSRRYRPVVVLVLLIIVLIEVLLLTSGQSLLNRFFGLTRP